MKLLQLHQFVGKRLGHASIGYQYAKVRMDMDASSEYGDYKVVPTSTFDLTLGPIKGSYQTLDTANAEHEDETETADSEYPNLKIEAQSLGLDYNLGRIVSSAAVINLLNYTGIFRPHFEFTREKLTRAESEDVSLSVTSRKWDLELPVAFGYFDLIYGYSLWQTDIDTFRDITRSAFVKFLYNNFMPFAQLQLGYQTIWKDAERSTGQVLTFGLYAGL